MLRTSRHAKILEIISHQEIETQDELCEELRKVNFVVTQATVSRDIRDLHLFKVAGIEKKYRYAYINESEGEISLKMRNLFRDCVLSIKSAQNLVVVKTLTGNAPNAGAVVDKLNYSEVVGSVAGDDPILLVVKTSQGALELEAELREIFKIK